MTKEEKINTLKAIIQECEEYQWQRKEILFEIIKDLEQEPTTNNDLGVNKTFYEQIMEYCKEHFLVLVEKDVWDDAEKALTTKNDLVVDCIDRAKAQAEIEMNASRYTIAKERGGMGQVEWSDQLIKVSDAVDIIRNLPPVTPQLSSELDKNSKKLEKDFGELDCISRVDAIYAVSEALKHIFVEYEDIANKVIGKLPPVTPIRPKGHWINKQRLFDSCSAECSACHKCSNGYMHDNGFSLECKYYDFCPKCGADMRGNTTRKGKPIEGNNESYNCENWIP